MKNNENEEYENIEVDRLFDGLLGSKLYAMQLEYFDCINKIEERREMSNYVCKNIFKLPLGDQLRIMKKAIELSDIYEEILNKHGWSVGE